MATFYVDASAGTGGNGTSGSPWKTMAQAVAGVNNGDAVRIRPGKYGPFKLETPAKHSNTKWMADNPNNRPYIDGGYSIAAMTGSGNNVHLPVAPGSGQGALVGIDPGVVNVILDGLIVQNSPGDGIACNGNNATLLNSVIYFTYRNGLMVNPPDYGYVDGLTVKNCKIIKTSVRYLANIDEQGSAGVILRELHGNVLFQDCEVAYGHGETFDIDKPSFGTEAQKFVFERLLLHDSNHTTLYFNQCRYVIFRDSCAFYSHQGSEIHLGGPGEMGYTCRIKDENRDYPWNSASYLDIYNNIFVNGGGLFIDGERDTNSRAVYVGANTFVGGNWTKGNLVVKYAPAGSYRVEGIFENNIIDLTQASGYNAKVGQVSGNHTLVIRNNLWSHMPHTSIRGVDSKFEDPKLVNPGALIVTSNYFTAAMDSYEKVTTACNFNPNNYKPRSNSPAIGAGSTGGSATNTNPVTPAPARARQVDRAGTNRGATPDIGAWEYQAGGGDPDPDPAITASFTRTPASGDAPLSVAFTDTSQATGGATITGWSWDFGDGGTSTAHNPTHVYAAAGTYTTTLTIMDAGHGLTSSVSGGTVTVAAPITGSVTASFTRTPAAAEVGEAIHFTDTSTETGDATINSWSWDFRDGTGSTARNPTKIYNAAGTYRPRLTVADTARGYANTWTGPQTVISDAPPAASLEASFTPSATSGQAPLEVDFTDTSQASGTAEIDSWSWAFGDGGTSTAQNPTHVYATPGTYVVTLTAQDTSLGLVDVSAGTTITVTVAPPPAEGGGDVVLRQNRQALNTGNGPQTFSQSGLGGLTPKRARFIVTGATADGAAADGELLCVGATAGGRQWAACMAAQHGAANTNAARMWTDAACMLLIDPSGAEVMRATFVSWAADGVVVDVQWTGTPVGYLCTVDFGAGTEYEAWVGTVALGAVGSTATPAVGFAADAIRVVATWGARETAAPDATLSLGLGHRTYGEYVLERFYGDGLADAENRTRLFGGEVAHCRYNTPQRAGVAVGDWSATGMTLGVTGSDINSSVLVLAEKFGSVASRLMLAHSATAAGSQDYPTSWNPQYVDQLISLRQGEGSNNDNGLSGTIGLHTVTVDGEFSNLVSGENGSATTNEQSLSDDRLVVVSHTGVTLTAGVTTLTEGKYAINYATAPPAAQKWPSLEVEEGQATGGGEDYVTAQFGASVTAGDAPLRVQFTDLSSGTRPITSWLWDFGDGQTAATRNPAHIYREAGAWAVSLTVGDGTLTDTITKVGLIVVTVEALEEFFIGPFVMRPIGEDSSPVTHKDPGDAANAGYMEGGLALERLRLGEWVIYPDEADGTLKVLFADGTVKTVVMS